MPKIKETYNQYISYAKKANGKNLYNKIKTLSNSIGNDEILRASFSGKTPKGSDLENILFYNIGSGCFSKLIKKGVIFEERQNGSCLNQNNCIYEYELIKNTPNYFNKMPIVKCDCGEIFDKTVAECWKEIKKVGWKICTSFKYPVQKIFLDIVINNPTRKNLTIDKIKHMLDGIVSSLHKYNGGNSIAIAQKLGIPINWLTDPNILVDREFVSIKNSNGNLKWNPADDRTTLKGCRIRINKDAKEASTEINVIET